MNFRIVHRRWAFYLIRVFFSYGKRYREGYGRVQVRFVPIKNAIKLTIPSNLAAFLFSSNLISSGENGWAVPQFLHRDLRVITRHRKVGSINRGGEIMKLWKGYEDTFCVYEVEEGEGSTKYRKWAVKDYNLSGEVGIQDVLWHDRTCRSGLCTIQMQDVRHTTACRLVTVLKTEDRIR